MSWVQDFYSETGRWWGAAQSALSDRDHERVAAVRRLTGATSGRLLDLGSSYGNTAAAFALAGYDVIGVEISERIDYARTHLTRLAETPGAGGLIFARADFNTFALRARADVVTYWNGFGVGNDGDQRRLLRTIAAEWLAPGGHVVLDVFNPTRWVTWVGDEEHLAASPEQGYPYDVSQRMDYDPVRARFVDTWCRTGQRPITQTQRCYSPPDLLLLLEPIPLDLVAIEVDGTPIDLDAAADSTHPLYASHQYRVVLRATP